MPAPLKDFNEINFFDNMQISREELKACTLIMNEFKNSIIKLYAPHAVAGTTESYKTELLNKGDVEAKKCFYKIEDILKPESSGMPRMLHYNAVKPFAHDISLLARAFTANIIRETALDCYKAYGVARIVSEEALNGLLSKDPVQEGRMLKLYKDSMPAIIQRPAIIHLSNFKILNSQTSYPIDFARSFLNAIYETSGITNGMVGHAIKIVSTYVNDKHSEQIPTGVLTVTEFNVALEKNGVSLPSCVLG